MRLDRLLDLPGRMLVRFITRPSGDYRPHSIHRSDQLAGVIQPCDILLVEGDLWVSGAIKYLSQSTWSHAAMYVGDIIDPDQERDDPKVLIEADLRQGVIGVPLSKYVNLNTRICRPVGLSMEDKSKVISYMMRNLGNAYDLKNVIDLARYLLPTPPVPPRFRRKMIGLGSGDPTRAICSSLIAQAFQTVRYPILPEAAGEEGEEIYRIRHSTLFAPRDFDLSPFFEIIKPTISMAGDYKSMKWEDRPGVKY